MCNSCGCKTKVYDTRAVLCGGTGLSLVIPVDFDVLQDRQTFNFRVCQKIPAGGECLEVQISIAGTAYPLWNKFGSPTFGNEIKCGKTFCGYYDAGHFITHDAPVSCIMCCN